jgi:YD repeat-containing protein
MSNLFGPVISFFYCQGSRSLPVTALVVSILCSSDVCFASAVYSYDATGRVASVLYDNGVCEAYGYDADGNRTVSLITFPQGPAANWGAGTWGCFTWTWPGPAQWGVSTWGRFSWKAP